MTRLADLLPLVNVVIWAGGAALSLGGLLHYLLRRRRAPAAWQRLESLGGRSYAGFEVVPITEPDGGKGLALVYRGETPEGCSLLLDTNGDRELPGELMPVSLGDPGLDRRLLRRGATPSAARGLRAWAAPLRQVTDILRGWSGRLGAVRVSGNEARFLFDDNQLVLAERALPLLARFAGAVLSAAWWLPPAGAPGAGAGAFRGASAVGPEARAWYLEELGPGGRSARRGPFTLEEILALLREGKVSWLTRAACGDQAPLLPLARCEALRTVLVPASSGGAAAAEPAAAEPAPAPVRRLNPSVLAEFYIFYLLAWVMLFIAGLFAAPNLFRASRGEASTRWPSTRGHVFSSRLITDRTDEGELRWSPAIKYSYSAGGANHVGDRVLFYYRWRFEGHVYDRAAVERVLARYPVGREVRVYYDPAHPEVSVLEPGLVGVELAAGLVALGFMGLAALLLGLLATWRVQVWRARQRAARGFLIGR